MLPQKDKRTHNDHDGHSKEQSISAHTLWCRTAELAPRDDQGWDKYRERREACFPEAVSLRGCLLRGFLWRSSGRGESNHCKPSHRRHQRHIKEAARIVEMQINRLTGGHRTDAIQQCRSKKLAVNNSPSSTASARNEDETPSKHQLFASIE